MPGPVRPPNRPPARRTRAGGRSATPAPVRRTRAGGRLRAGFAVLALLLVAGCGLPRWPVHGPLTSPYGLRIRGFIPDIHEGVDIAVPVGTPVRAMKGGRVIRAGPRGGYGLAVEIRHGPTVTAIYAHLSEIHVREGQEVRGRQVIGLSGRSGSATGPHLHFELRRGGRPVDPVPLLGREPG